MARARHARAIWRNDRQGHRRSQPYAQDEGFARSCPVGAPQAVTRRANRADLREAFLSLTTAGRDVYGELAPIALDFARDLLETVDAADRAALDRALIKLTERSAELAPPTSHIANGRRPR